jgi:hypothetical protein
MGAMTSPDSGPRGRAQDAEPTGASGPVSVDRIASFLFVSGAILLFLSAFLLTIRGFERFLQLHFERVVEEAIQVEPGPRPPGDIIGDRLHQRVDETRWVRFWGVQVDVVVTARDGQTWLYVNGQPSVWRYPNPDPQTLTQIHAELLPALATVNASVGHNTLLFSSILVLYAGIFLMGFFVYNRNVVDHQIQVIDAARQSRDQAASTAQRIAKELDSVRSQLREVEPAAQQDREEILRLQSEQQELRTRLDTLAARERELRGQADRAAVLEEDSRVLEEMLEEATDNLSAKDAEIRELEQSLKRSARSGGATSGRSRLADALGKRLRTLYPKLDFDDRAIADLVALPDETTRLRAEECIKKLAEDADNIRLRRKVGGLPNYLSIYELGFSGKRRVYYAKTGNGRYRVLVVGAKNTQDKDLEYLSRIPKGELVA